jgi:hypothetical protein
MSACRTSLPLCVLTTAQDADIGVTGDAGGIPASQAVSVGVVAAWSVRCRLGTRRAGVGVGTVAVGRGRARTSQECDRQPVLAGVTSRPWVNWPISVQGGASRARTVTAAAANAVNASPRLVDSAARVARTSRSTWAIHPNAPVFHRAQPINAKILGRIAGWMTSWVVCSFMHPQPWIVYGLFGVSMTTWVDFTTATASEPGAKPSSRAASVLISETTR